MVDGLEAAKGGRTVTLCNAHRHNGSFAVYALMQRWSRGTQSGLGANAFKNASDSGTTMTEREVIDSDRRVPVQGHLSSGPALVGKMS